MIVYMEITPESRKVLAAHARIRDRLGEVLFGGLQAAGAAGANHVGELLQTHQLGLKSQSGGMGIAGAVASWPVDGETVAVGVPKSSPAHAYAGIQETGGVIRAKPGKALAVPLTDAARQLTSPLDASAAGVELVFISRKDKGSPPLLAQVIGEEIKPWYVLLKSVTLKATHWLTDGVAASMAVMAAGMQHVIDREVDREMEK